MNSLNLSKSKYCRILQCNKMYWLNTYKPEVKTEVDKEKIFANGKKVGELAKGLFGKYTDIEFNIDKSKMIVDTEQAIECGAKVITEASFMYDNNFCSVDILRNTPKGMEIYEVKSSTEVSDIYKDDASYQYYVLNNLGYNVKKVSIIHINSSYIFHKELELDKLFEIVDVTDEVIERQNKVQETIKEINDFMKSHDNKHEPDIDIGIHCTNPYDCEYWKYCTRKLPHPNVFDLKSGIQMSSKFKLYNDGIITFEDLQSVIDNEKNLEQIDFELNNREPKINKGNIKEFLKQLKYPLYFVDFESYQLAIPEYEGTRPYQQLVFQYSLHIIEKEGAEIEHKEFLAGVNDRDFLRHFAESLIADIPENGSVIVYNKSFENTQMNELGRIFPDLESELLRICDNIVDFMIPFKNRDYYLKEMDGLSTIKKVLPALYPNDPELDYHNLKYVHNGGEAPEVFLSLKDKDEEEREVLIKALLKYCELDTWAMVKIWEKLKEVVE